MIKKVLKNNKKTKQYLDKLPKMYIVGRWAKFGVSDYSFTGKYIEVDGISIPLVYKYYDANGTTDMWYLCPITQVTTGAVIMWTQNKPIAERIAKALNTEDEKRLQELRGKF